MNDHPPEPGDDPDNSDCVYWHERPDLFGISPRFDWSRDTLTPEQEAALEAVERMPPTAKRNFILRAIDAGKWPPV